MKIKAFTLVTVMALGSTGCATNQGHIGPNFGVANKAAMSKQIVTTAVTPGAPEMHPVKANAAVQRYLNDEVKEPKSTQEITSEVE